MRELAVAGLLLLALVAGALAPKVWPDEATGTALASGRPAVSGPLATVASTAFAAVSWKGKDGGTGFVVCGSTQKWSRPTVDEQNIHLAADPRYARMAADDPGSDAWLRFRSNAVFYDGSTIGARIDLVTLTGMWTDPHSGGNAAGCSSVEPQIWLFGWEPVSYRADDRDLAYLNVVPAGGYRMVVLTGTLRPHIVVAGGPKLAVFTMPGGSAETTPAPAIVAPSYVPLPNEGPRELTLPDTCRILQHLGHPDPGETWTIQCGSAAANLSVAVAAMRQGWTHLDGPPLGVGLQTYKKGSLTMQVAYRLDPPGYSDPIRLVQYARPFSAGEPSPANPLAYVGVPMGLDLPAGCTWGPKPAGFTSDGAYEIPFACRGMPASEIRGAFHRALLAQGWRAENGGFGFTNYTKDNLRLTAMFVNEKAEPSDLPWVVEALCCFAP